MQKPTEKMLTDVQKDIASIHSISANVKADNAGDSSTNSSPSFDIWSNLSLKMQDGSSKNTK